jgi:hypothetical protein
MNQEQIDEDKELLLTRRAAQRSRRQARKLADEKALARLSDAMNDRVEFDHQVGKLRDKIIAVLPTERQMVSVRKIDPHWVPVAVVYALLGSLEFVLSRSHFEYGSDRQNLKSSISNLAKMIPEVEEAA